MQPAVLLAAAHLRIPSRRLRRLALGEEDALREWLAHEQAGALARSRARTREDLALLERLHARIVSLGDPTYPAGLRDLTDPPPFLTVIGTLPARGVAIVGSRTAGDDARAFARALAARLGLPVVSGLASGIDAAAHEGALEGEHPTLAYVGTGIGQTYPPEHRDLQDRIVQGGGAIASERLPSDRVTRWGLVRRDRLQAAHARAVVLVATESDGGAMHTMRFAAALGRPRFAVEEDAAIVGDGNAIAIAAGAAPLPLDPSRARAIVASALEG